MVMGFFDAKEQPPMWSITILEMWRCVLRTIFSFPVLESIETRKTKNAFGLCFAVRSTGNTCFGQPILMDLNHFFIGIWKRPVPSLFQKLHSSISRPSFAGI